MEWLFWSFAFRSPCISPSYWWSIAMCTLIGWEALENNLGMTLLATKFLEGNSSDGLCMDKGKIMEGTYLRLHISWQMTRDSSRTFWCLWCSNLSRWKLGWMSEFKLRGVSFSSEFSWVFVGCNIFIIFSSCSNSLVEGCWRKMIWKPSILNARRPHLGQEFSARIAAKAAACDLPAACQKSAAGVLLWEDDLGRSAKSFANNMCLLHWLQIGEDRISWCPGGCFDCYFQLQIVLMFSNWQICTAIWGETWRENQPDQVLI